MLLVLTLYLFKIKAKNTENPTAQCGFTEYKNVMSVPKSNSNNFTLFFIYLVTAYKRKLKIKII